MRCGIRDSLNNGNGWFEDRQRPFKTVTDGLKPSVLTVLRVGVKQALRRAYDLQPAPRERNDQSEHSMSTVTRQEEEPSKPSSLNPSLVPGQTPVSAILAAGEV